uniref:Uncharacterized protein n=1 Tax=Knipowitschia caucasica TaxID=637954 RepID=A0AAV2MAS3_KNICA
MHFFDGGGCSGRRVRSREARVHVFGDDEHRAQRQFSAHSLPLARVRVSNRISTSVPSTPAVPAYNVLHTSSPHFSSHPCPSRSYFSGSASALPPLIRSLSTEPHVSESIRAESRRGRSFTEVNIKLHQAPWRNRGSKHEREVGAAGGERSPSVPNPPHRSGGDEAAALPCPHACPQMGPVPQGCPVFVERGSHGLTINGIQWSNAFAFIVPFSATFVRERVTVMQSLPTACPPAVKESSSVYKPGQCRRRRGGVEKGSRYCWWQPRELSATPCPNRHTSSTETLKSTPGPLIHIWNNTQMSGRGQCF